ncbi:MAG: hypothetical protein WBR56_13685 [Sedimenticolaceae bacterium]
MQSESIELVLLLELELPLPSDPIQSTWPAQGHRSAGALVKQQQFSALAFLQDPLLALLLAIALPLYRIRHRLKHFLFRGRRLLNVPEFLLICPIQLHMLRQIGDGRISAHRRRIQ